MNKQTRIDELEAEIKQLQQAKIFLGQWDATITSLESFTRDDKVQVFDELYLQARRHLQEYVDSGREPKDGDNYIYEAVLSKMLGEKVWAIIRATAP